VQEFIFKEQHYTTTNIISLNSENNGNIFPNVPLQKLIKTFCQVLL
jgi:hypothetical protein